MVSEKPLARRRRRHRSPPLGGNPRSPLCVLLLLLPLVLGPLRYGMPCKGACQQLFMAPRPLCAGSWHRAAFLMCTSVSQPTLLGLPFGIACLGWAGGMTVLIVAAIATGG